MKTKFLLLALSCCLVMASCSSGKTLNLDQGKAAATIQEEITFKDELLKADPGIIDNFYPGLDKVSGEYTIYISGTGVTCEEIAIVKAKDGVKTADVEEHLKNRVEEQKIRYENYQPVEMVKLGKPVIESKSGTTIMVLSDDPAKASEVIAKLFEGK